MLKWSQMCYWSVFYPCLVSLLKCFPIPQCISRNFRLKKKNLVHFQLYWVRFWYHNFKLLKIKLNFFPLPLTYSFLFCIWTFIYVFSFIVSITLYTIIRSFPGGQTVKHLPAMQETQVQPLHREDSLGQEDPLEKGMATQSSILAWRIPWTEEPGRLQPMGLQSCNWLTNTYQIHISDVYHY